LHFPFSFSGQQKQTNPKYIMVYKFKICITATLAEYTKMVKENQFKQTELIGKGFIS
jgi:hypothetical protein